MRKIKEAFSHVNLRKKWDDKSISDWKEPTSNEEIIKSAPLELNNYEKYIEAIAQLSFYNRDHILFYRGQKKEFLNDDNESKLFPQIYRDSKNYSFQQLWEKLNETDKQLRHHFNRHYSKFAGASIFLKYQELRWAIMQHYLIEKTPLLDITHSPYVAASFAQHENENQNGVVYILGMPSLSNTIDINTEDELILIRLLAFCLPQAKRPYLQEAYAVGPYPNYKLNDNSEKDSFNFSRRLIAKFSIPNTDDFWGADYSRIPDRLLDYENDSIEQFLDVFRIENIFQ